MAAMTPGDFFYGFLYEEYQDWDRDSSQQCQSLRKAFSLSIMLGHMADHFYKYHEKRNTEFRSMFPSFESSFLPEAYNRCPNLKIIRSMSNAFKHLYTYNSQAVSSGGSVEIITSHDKSEVFSENWEDERIPTLRVSIQTRKNGKVWFDEAAKEVFEFWSDVVQSKPPAEYFASTNSK